MKNIISLEEIAMFLLTLFAFSFLPFSWWIFVALLVVPDVSMLGYLINAKIGAICYNIAHHKAIAILVYFIGFKLNYDMLALAGIILFAHASMDRIFGYGLKYFDAFKHTHLGIIGKK